MILKLGGNTRFMDSRFNHLFLKHHRHACEIIVDRNGSPMAAVYFTPAGKHPEYLRGLMAEIRRRTEG